MINKYRLSSSYFDRESESDRIEPKKIYFMAVEGTRTEVQYFRKLNEHKSELGINAVLQVQVLDHKSKDGYSAPTQVLELLKDCYYLRKEGELFRDSPNQRPLKDIFEKYGEEFIGNYLKNKGTISEEKLNEFYRDLYKAGIDIKYLEYLHDVGGNDSSDHFCIVIDRDKKSHSEEMMKSVISECNDNGYECYISNPCFELWLLFHRVDVKEKYKGQYDKIIKNEKISNKHTFVSYELSKISHHGKDIRNFESFYLPNIRTAIKRAKEFELDNYGLIDKIGSNVAILVEKILDDKD